LHATIAEEVCVRAGVRRSNSSRNWRAGGVSALRRHARLGDARRRAHYAAARHAVPRAVAAPPLALAAPSLAVAAPPHALALQVAAQVVAPHALSLALTAPLSLAIALALAAPPFALAQETSVRFCC
jgi:hypothetical protein